MIASPARLAGLFVAAIAAGSCATPAEREGSLASSAELARSVVQAALGSGAFEALLDQAVTAAFGAARSQIVGSGRTLSTEQTQQLEASLRKVFAEVYPLEAWEEALLPVFLEGFDRRELEEVRAFQQTPLGAKLLAAQARLATGGGAIGQRLVRSRQAQFNARLTEELAVVWGGRGPGPDSR